ncbi:serine/threonine-protein phosphatase [Jiella sp. MQZ13P-4]|uniref:Serine/threonine-protein phosphatase n=2 Tax=Jiella sonneratiae TaxID=2816856 RepID=A0ABS3J6Z1_9HYPH|nr:serine/threonine-protein phosphatase [Jiella sonneratiae]
MTRQVFRLDVFGKSHVGRVRSLNEDRCFADAAAGVFAVADGMGGHRGGDLASAAIVERLATVGIATTAADLRARVEARLDAANDAILDLATAAGATIGSTVVVLLLFAEHFACLWAGDSRAYRLSRGLFARITRDHSKLQELLDAGLIAQHEAATYPGRNVITRAVGVSAAFAVERTSDVVRPGDVFLLCSDGLTNHVGDAEIAAILARPGAREAAEALVAAALSRGGSDNVTALVLRCLPPPRGTGAGNG